MPFPGTPPVLSTSITGIHSVRLDWIPAVPDTGLVVFDYLVAYTRVDPAPAWPYTGGPFTPDGGWFLYKPHSDPTAPRPPTTTITVGLSPTFDGVLHHFIVEASLANDSDPTTPSGFVLASNVADGTPVGEFTPTPTGRFQATLV